MKVLIDFRNTIIGIVIVAILLIVFSLVFWAVNAMFPGTGYAPISGLVAIAIVFIGCTFDYYNKLNQTREKAYIEQLGISTTTMPTEEDLEGIEQHHRITYPENLKDVVNPKKDIKIVAA